MGFKRFSHSLTWQLVLLVAVSGGSVWAVSYIEWSVLPFALLSVGYLIFRIRKLYRLNAQKVAFMFDAINNNDYAFKYTTDGYS